MEIYSLEGKGREVYQSANLAGNLHDVAKWANTMRDLHPTFRLIAVDSLNGSSSVIYTTFDIEGEI